GLLDQTHLRFFTRRSLLDWMAEVGLAALSIDTVQMELSNTEFSHVGLEGFSPAVREQLLSSEDALTYQFVVQAVPVGQQQRPALVANKQPTAAVTFLTRMRWAADDAAFDESRGHYLRARLGVDPQRLRFPLPALASRNVSLRFDVADRPGFVRLYDI